MKIFKLSDIRDMMSKEYPCLIDDNLIYAKSRIKNSDNILLCKIMFDKNDTWDCSFGHVLFAKTDVGYWVKYFYDSVNMNLSRLDAIIDSKKYTFDEVWDFINDKNSVLNRVINNIECYDESQQCAYGKLWILDVNSNNCEKTVQQKLLF